MLVNTSNDLSLPAGYICAKDCISGMNEYGYLLGEFIDLAITSPPYNIGKEYESKTSLNDYLNFSREYLKLIYKMLKPGSSLMLQIGCYVDKHTNNVPLTYHLYPILNEIGFKLRQEIVWHFKGGMQARKKLTGQNEKIMWLYKGDNLPYFNLDEIRVKEWKAIDKRNNPNGKNPTDLWEINRVAGNSKEKVGHPCQFPEAMIERLVKGWSKEGDLILDPFMGSGTTAVVATKNNRRFLGFEKEVSYIEMARKRLSVI